LLPPTRPSQRPSRQGRRKSRKGPLRQGRSRPQPSIWNEQPLGMNGRAEIDVIRRITPRVLSTSFAQFGDAPVCGGVGLRPCNRPRPSASDSLPAPLNGLQQNARRITPRHERPLSGPSGHRAKRAPSVSAYAQFRGVAVRASVTTLQEREVHRSKLTRTYRAVNHRAARAELRIDSSGGSTGSACSIFRGIGPRPGLQAPARHVWTSKAQLEMGKNRLGSLARNFSAGGVRADPNERR
jgi:hypothetical protein